MYEIMHTKFTFSIVNVLPQTNKNGGQMVQLRSNASIDTVVDPQKVKLEENSKNALNSSADANRNKNEPSGMCSIFMRLFSYCNLLNTDAFALALDDSGWETVKNRSRWRLSYNYNPKQRFNKPTCAVSLPALIIIDDEDEISSNKNLLCKQSSQDASSLRRHSERAEPSSSEIGKIKKSLKPKPNDVPKPNKGKVEVCDGSNGKQMSSKKSSKGPREVPLPSKTKTVVCMAYICQ